MSKLKSNLISKYRSLSLPLRAGFWFTLANFLQRGLTMITTPIFTRLLSKEQYGLASTYSAWQNVLTLVVTLSLYKSLLNLFKDYDNQDAVTTSVSTLSILISSIWVVLGILFSSQLSNVFGMSQALTMGLFISFIPQAIINCWAVRKRYQYAYKACIIQSLITVVGSTFFAAVCVIFISPTAESKILPSVIVSLIVAIILYFNMIKRSRAFYNKQIWVFSLGFCIALLPHYLSEFVLQSSDKLMINAMCGKEDVAVYSIAYSVGSLINLITNSLNSTLFPYRYQRLKDQNYKQLAKVSNEMLAFVGIVLLAIMLMASEIINFFGGKQYAEAQYLVIPICLGVYFNYVFQSFSTVQEFYERKVTIVIASISCAVLNIILNYIFIGLCGYQAAAYTTFFCYMLFSFVHYMFYRKVCREELDGAQIYNIKGVLIVSIAVVIGGLLIMRIIEFAVLRYIVSIIAISAAGWFAKKYIDFDKK